MTAGRTLSRLDGRAIESVIALTVAEGQRMDIDQYLECILPGYALSKKISYSQDIAGDMACGNVDCR